MRVSEQCKEQILDLFGSEITHLSCSEIDSVLGLLDGTSKNVIIDAWRDDAALWKREQRD